MEEIKNKTSIQVTVELRDWIAAQGKKDDTFEDILRLLLNYPNQS